MIRRATVSLLACVGLLGTSACKSGTTPAPEAPRTTAIADQQLTAGDAFGVLRALHAVEADHGLLARRKAADPRVRAFAEKVAGDHADRLQKDAQLTSGLSIEPTDNAISKQLESAARRRTAKVDSMTGSDFDCTYLDEQVSYCRIVLDTIATELLPNSTDPRVRASLLSARERANEQLHEAQALRDAVSTEPAPTEPAPSDDVSSDEESPDALSTEDP